MVVDLEAIPQGLAAQCSDFHNCSLHLAESVGQKCLVLAGGERMAQSVMIGCHFA